MDYPEQLGQWIASGEGISGTGAGVYVLAYKVCSTFTPAEFVKQGTGPAAVPTPIDAAETYARETFQAQDETAGFKGCLTAFNGEP